MSNNKKGKFNVNFDVYYPKQWVWVEISVDTLGPWERDGDDIITDAECGTCIKPYIGLAYINESWTDPKELFNGEIDSEGLETIVCYSLVVPSYVVAYDEREGGGSEEIVLNSNVIKYVVDDDNETKRVLGESCGIKK